MTKSTRLLIFVLLLPAVVLVSGCRTGQTSAAEATAPAAPATAAAATTASGPRTLIVFAASSLAGPFEALGRQFEASHPGVKVLLTTAGTQELRVQAEQGARFDVFASASKQDIEALTGAALVRDAVPFAGNRLVVVTYPGQPHVKTLEDLTTADAKVVVGTPTSPIGRYTRQCFEKIGKAREFGPPFLAALQKHIVSEETNAKLVLTKVSLGEADAGFVYYSDAQGKQVEVLELPAEIQVRARYLAGAGVQSPQPDLAREYLALLTGAEGRAALQQAGFEAVAKPAAPAP